MMSTRITPMLVALVIFVLGALPTGDSLWAVNATVDVPRAAISLSSTGFTPAILVVTVGAEVTWTNETAHTQILQSGIPHHLYLPLLAQPTDSTAPAGQAITDQVQPTQTIHKNEITATSFRATLPPGGTFAHTFTAVGEYPYFLDGDPNLRGRVVVVSEIPADPAGVAPPLDQTVVTDLATATEFLYTGVDPIQSGVAAGTMEARRVAVIRGRVLDVEGKALPGVVLTVLNHPAYGQTRSRSDGLFDLVVNGGGLLTVVYTKAGYPTLQRQIEIPWQEYVWLPDVVMIPYDTQVTAINLGAASQIQVARGSVVSDKDGVRQSTLLFPPGVQATMIVAAEGVTSRSQLSTMHVRATEYTVGDTGPAAMPAALPDNVGYTYAMEFSADEALVAGAVDVQFDQPVINYVENFLGAPVGGIVPVGYYDKVKGAWIPSENGLVVKVLSIQDGKAQLDIDGSGNAASSSALAALGVTADEQQKLAQLYQPGQSLWRVPIAHFTPWDCNWPYGPPEDAEPPRQPVAQGDNPLDDPCQVAGSIIECQGQVLGEVMDVVGTPFHLHYRSDRVEGRTAAQTLDIPLSGPSVPPGLVGIEFEIGVAGRHFTHTVGSAQSCGAASMGGTLPARANVAIQSPTNLTNQSYTFVWDGKDGYGRRLLGRQPVSVRIGYVYCGVYMQPAKYFDLSFGRYSGTLFTGSVTRNEIILWQEWQSTILLENRGLLAGSVGGWSIDVHHVYDPTGRTLNRGDGRRISVANRVVIDTVAGGGAAGLPYLGNDGPATEAQLAAPAHIAVGADGSVYIPGKYANGGRIQRLLPGGTLVTVAGNFSSSGFSGDGGLATQAQLNNPHGVALGPDGSLYIADTFNHRIRRVDPQGIITTVAGSGPTGWNQGGLSGDGGPATQARLNMPKDVAIAADGSLYIADTENNRIRRVNPAGFIETVVGNGPTGGVGEFGGDGGPANLAKLGGPESIALGPDGSLYIADLYNHRVRRVTPDGIIDTAAGDGAYCSDQRLPCGDGGPAILAQFYAPNGVALSTDGILYITDGSAHRVRRVDLSGSIATIAGSGPVGFTSGSFAGDGGIASQARLSAPGGVAMSPDGALYVADTWNHRIRRVGAVMPGYSVEDIIVAAEDGSQIFVFNSHGRHLRTLNALTDATIFRFAYDDQGWLIGIMDGDGNHTHIERDGQGNPTAIVAPHGQRTVLGVDANGYLASVADPAGALTRFIYSDGGLLRTLTDPRGGVHHFTYADLGRLRTNQDPEGNVQSLTRTAANNAVTVTLTSALNRTTTYATANLSSGAEERINRFPDGTRTTAHTGADGSFWLALIDGTRITQVDGPDPRFGMQSPVGASTVVTTPGGLTLTLALARTTALADPLDISTLLVQTDTVNVSGQLYTSVYQASNRTFVDQTPAGRVFTTVIDAQGRAVREEWPGLHPLLYTYDAQGRLSSESQGGGNETRQLSYVYNDQGWLSAITDATGRTATFSYDPAGRAISAALPGKRTVAFSYDAGGNLTSLTPPGRTPHQFGYTALDQLNSYTPPGGSATRFLYNADGQLQRITRADGSEIAFSYNAGGQLTATDVAAGSIAYTYDAHGRVQRVSAPGGVTLSYGYDGALPVSLAWTGPINASLGLTYDDNFIPIAQTVNGGSPVDYHYNKDRLLIEAGDLILTRGADSGRVTATTLAGVTDAFAYNLFGEITRHTSSYGGAAFYTADYSYDRLGRVIAKTETIAGVATTYGYAYSVKGYLSGVTRNGTVVAQYGFDANGNRTSVQDSSGSLAATFDGQDRLIQQGADRYTYNSAGDLERITGSGGVTGYEYDALGNLRRVTLPTGEIITYQVDGRQSRVGRLVDGQPTHSWIYLDPLHPVAEFDGNGQLISHFIYGTREHVPDVMLRDGKRYRLVTDLVGSVRLVVDVDSGAIAQRIDYDSFGRVVQDTNPGFQPFGFAGGLYDPLTGLVRFGARDYDPQAGRWTAPDPQLFDGGQSNLYSYVDNDPINRLDPTGEGFWEKCKSIYNRVEQWFGWGKKIQSGYKILVEKDPAKAMKEVCDEFIPGTPATDYVKRGCKAGIEGGVRNIESYQRRVERYICPAQDVAGGRCLH